MMKSKLLIMLSMAGLCLFYGSRGSVEPSASLVDRSALARTSASSFRLARIEEIPRAQEFSSIRMDRPDNWPRRLPLYAADHSPLTQWATDGNGPEHLQFDFANNQAGQVLISGLRVHWGADFASRYLVSVSADGKAWSALKEGQGSAGGVDEILFPQPRSARYLRLVCLVSGTGRGFSVHRLQVFGASEGRPEEPVGFRAEPVEGEVRLSWQRSRPGRTYRYCLFRSRDKNFSPSPDNRIVCTDKTDLIDRGLPPGTYFYRLAAESFAGELSPTAGPVAVELTGPAPAPPFRLRGVVEGFYNDPWPHTQRLKVISFLPSARMNYYLYAPKHDPYHRQLWREPYPPAEMDNFRELISAARAHGVTFNFGISPGLDFNHQDPADLERLKQKLADMAGLGVRAFTLCLDDITDWKKSDARTAARQVKLTNEIHRWLQERFPGSELIFVPTIYFCTYEHWVKNKSAYADYLKGLAALAPEIRVMWTGPGHIFSEKITLESAQSLSRLWDRKILIWDNNPVNDVTLRHHIIMAPYYGRDPRLSAAVEGVLLNPMFLPHSSLVTVSTAGEFLFDPQGYDPDRAYTRAIERLGGPRGWAALRALADTLAFHPLFPGQGVDRLPLTRKIDAFWKARQSGQGEEAAAAELRELFAVFVKVPAALEAGLDNYELMVELSPAAQKLALYGQAGLLALEGMNLTDPGQRMVRFNKMQHLRERANAIPWAVADNRLEGLYQPPGSAAGRRENVMENFLDRVLVEARP